MEREEIIKLKDLFGELASLLDDLLDIEDNINGLDEERKEEAAAAKLGMILIKLLSLKQELDK